LAMSCTPLESAGIYTVHHDQPLKYVEIYVEEFVRCIAVDLGQATLLSIDVYPESIKMPREGLASSRCISMEREGIELCEKDVPIEKTGFEARSLRVESARALFLCYEGTCSEIQLRLRVAAPLSDVLKLLCAEDVAELGLRGVEP